MNALRDFLRSRRWPALFMLAIMVTMPITVIAYGLDDGWSPLQRGTIEPEGWRGGPLEDLLEDSMEGDDSLLRMLDHIGATPETANVPVQSHVLGLATPPQTLPALYEAEALSSSTPLRTAVIAYNAGLDLMDAEDLLASADLRMADDLPFDAQVAIAVLLYAITDASLLQKEAVSGLSDEDYTALMGLPGMILSGRLDPTDGSEEADEDFAQAYGLLSQVDKRRIDEAALIMVHAVSHAMPSLRDWAQREREQAHDPDARVKEIGSLLDQYTPQRIDEMDPIERLDILADTLRMASGFQDVEVSPYLQPLPAPEGETPLRDAILDLADVLEAAGLPVGELVEESELRRADALPESMQMAVARIVANQAAVVQASVDLNDAVEAVESSIDADLLADPDALTNPDSLPDIPESQRDALLSALSDLRHAEIRTVLAVQQGAPTLEAWGLHWAREPSMLPATPHHAPGKLTDAAAMANAVADPATSLQEVMSLAGQTRGVQVDAVEAPLPPRGVLADSVLELYDRLGIDANATIRDDIQQGAEALHPTVERNTARILVAQLDALDALEALDASLSIEDHVALSRGAAALERLQAGEVSLRDVQAIRAHYEVRDRIESTYLDAAAGVAAAIDASSNELGEYADDVTGYTEPVEEKPKKDKPWYAKAWSAVSSIQVIGTASAQSTPIEPIHFPPVCPDSALADCDNDVWFMDPILETVVVSGFDETRFDPQDMGKDWRRPDVPQDERGSEAAAAAESVGQLLTIDLGGDDIYRNNAGGSSPVTVRGEETPEGIGQPSFTLRVAAVALDLGGDDRYLPAPDGHGYDAVQGAATAGIGVLYDRRGDDRYEAMQQAQGFAAGQFGIGVLLDGDGDDRYIADDFSQGAAQGSGIGILVDRAGTDHYTLGSASATGQGGAEGGLGLLVDAQGIDTYEDGMQGQGTDGGIGVFADLAGDDSHSRTHADDEQTAFGDGECWTSLRAPPSDAFADTNRSASNAPGVAEQAMEGSDDDPQGYVNATSDAVTGNATSIAGAVEGDATRVAADAQMLGVFVDLDDTSCKYDPSPLVPEEGVDPGTDPDAVLEQVIDLVGNVLEPGDEHLIDIPGVFALGDAANSTFDGAYEGIIDIGGNNTFLGRSSGATLLVNVDTNGDDRYLASGESCVQGCNAMLIDMGGDDTFVANSRSQGAVSGCAQSVGVPTLGLEVCAVPELSGLLFSGGGNDTYIIEDLSVNGIAQGGVDGNNGFGIGILLDVAGNDTYHSPSQGVVFSRMMNLVATQLGAQVGLFLDLGGVDAYQPAGRQGYVGTEQRRCERVTRDGMAAFVNVGGHDTYRGTVGNPANPDLSDHYNERLSVGFDVSGCVKTSSFNWYGMARGTPSLFWDLHADHPSALMREDPQQNPFRIAHLGIAVGTLEDELFEDDNTLLIDPGGNDTYRNNAGATMFRGVSSPSNGPNSLDTGNAPEQKTILSAGGTYDGGENHPIAALLIDLDGDDRYEMDDLFERDEGSAVPAADLKGVLTQGAGFLGVGVLVDAVGSDNTDPAAGVDHYAARAMSQGFGLYGWGLLWDRAGDDTYRYDPAVVQRPAIDGNLVAWLQYEDSNGDLVSDANIRGASGGTWAVKVRGAADVDWPRDCRVQIAGETGPFHGITVSRAADDRLAFSAFKGGVWRLFHVTDLGDSCGSGGTLNPDAHRPTATGANPVANQINPQFASILSDDDILWQDDRDGTWSLYYKDVGDASTTCARPLTSALCDADGKLLGGHDPATSNQTNPHAHRAWIVYQDDRYAGNECPVGTWSIHRYNLNTETEERLSQDCGVHVNPQMSDDFVVWQTRQVDDAGEPVGSWNLSVNRLTGPEPAGGRERLVATPGDQYDPVVVDETILYTNATLDGEYSVNQYFWDRDADLDDHRVERFGAVQPALDAQSRFRAVWVDTTGRESSGSNEVGSDYWEVYRRNLGTEALPLVPGSLRSNAAATQSQWLQGVSYANGRGILFDEGGGNTYVGDRFGQGAAASLVGPKGDFEREGGISPSVSGDVDAYGVLMDADGNDVHSVRREGQGVHFAREVVLEISQSDLGIAVGYLRVLDVETAASMGLLLDLRGNDLYEANRNSQGYGAWIPAGAAVTIDHCPPELQNPQPKCPPFAVYAVNSYGLFMDLGGFDNYAYGQSLYGNNINVGWGTCSNLDSQVLRPLQNLARKETVRQTVGPLADEAGIDFNETFNETTTDERFATREGAIAQILGPLMDTCRETEDIVEGPQEFLTNEPHRDRGGDGDRNDQIWRQKPRGGIEDTQPPCGLSNNGGKSNQFNRCPHPFVVGGVGMDLPLMDNLNAALRDVANALITADIDVTAIDGAGEVQEDEILGSVSLVTDASFKDDMGLQFVKAEFFAGLDSRQLLGDVRDAHKKDETTWTFQRPWHTDSGQFPDGPYELMVRVHYSHPQIGATLGYAEELAEFHVDNVPRILPKETTPFVADALTGDHLAAFSPFPFSDDSAGNPRLTFQIPPDDPPPEHPDAAGNQGHDGWIRVDALDNQEEHVAVILGTATTDALSSQVVSWDGTDDDGAVLPAGTYWIQVRATDREPGDWSGSDRVRTETFPVVVYSNTPRSGCVLAPDSQGCNQGGFITTQTPDATWQPGGEVLSVRLPLAASTDPGTAPAGGIEEIRRYHIRVGMPDEDGIAWGDIQTLNDGARSYNLHLAHGQEVHVLAVAEDWAGNLECVPACASAPGASVPTDASVVRGDDAALPEAFQNKLDLGELPDGAPVFATFQADFKDPIIRSARSDEVFLDGVRPTTTMPRVGPGTDVTITYTVEEDLGEPVPKLRWVPDEDINLTRSSTTGIRIDHDASRDPPWYNVTWSGWPELAADWPQGIVTLTVGASDQAGNAIRPANERVYPFLLDTTRPEIRGVDVQYPGGRSHAENRDVVTLMVDVIDPDIGTFTSHPRELQLEIDAHNVTVDPPADEPPCTLQFDRGQGCFVAGTRWKVEVPINTTGMDIDWGSLVAKKFNVTLNVADVAGNTLQENVPIVLGSPRLGPQRLQEEVGVYGANITWSTDRATTGYLLYGEGADAGSLVHRVNSTVLGTVHEFNLSGLAPGTRHVYRFVAIDPETNAEQAGDVIDFATLHGVGMELGAPQPDAPAEDKEISGLYTVHGRGWVRSALDDENVTIEPRVVIRLSGPGLPDGGRAVFDRQTQDGGFSMDLVTDALEDGVYTLETTVSYLGEENVTTVDGLLVDNTAPILRFVDPLDDGVLSAAPDRVLVRVTENLTPIDLASVRLHIDGRAAGTVDVTFHPDDHRHDGIIAIEGLPRFKPGIRHIEAFGEDRAGNPGHASIRALYDPDAPEPDAEVLYPDGQEAARPGQWITLRLSGEDGGSDIVRATADTTVLGGEPGIEFVRDAAQHVLELQVPASQPDGTYEVPVQVHGLAGNSGEWTAQFVVDATPPADPAFDFGPLGPGDAIAEVNASEPVTVVVQAAADGLEPVRALAENLGKVHVLHLQGLQAGTEYEVDVRVRDRAGNEVSLKETVRFQPELGEVPAVTGLVATSSPTQVRLAWDGGGDGFRYVVHRAQDGAFETVAVARSPTYTDSDVGLGAYRYFVQAIDPHDRPGLPSRVVDVDVPAPEMESEGTSVSVYPKTGVAQVTEFVFTATLQGARKADPSVWLVMGDDSRRMSKAADQDCRDSCTFRHVTTLQEADMRRPTLEYHVEVFDASGAVRLPEAGSLEGPVVSLAPGGGVPASEREASGFSALLVMAALASMLFVRRRHSQ